VQCERHLLVLFLVRFSEFAVCCCPWYMSRGCEIEHHLFPGPKPGYCLLCGLVQISLYVEYFKFVLFRCWFTVAVQLIACEVVSEMTRCVSSEMGWSAAYIHSSVTIHLWTCWQPYIQYMRFARRAEGIKSARAVFKMAREDTRTTYQLYVAAALMEYYCSKVTDVALSGIASYLSTWTPAWIA